MGIVKNGVNLRALGGTMRKFRRHQPRSLRFRLFLVVVGTLLLAGAFVPRTHAQIAIAYWNFDDGLVDNGPVNLISDAPGLFQNLMLVPGGPVPYAFPDMRNSSPGLNDNSISGPSVFGMGLAGSGRHNPALNMPATFCFALPAGTLLVDMTFSFAINRSGNGFTFAGAAYSTTGINGPYTTFIAPTFLVDGATTVISGALPAGAENQPNLAICILLTGGQSNGVNVQNVLDNILLEGTLIPEPTTVAGGLLGVLGLCWFQRRRLLSALRLRRT